MLFLPVFKDPDVIITENNREEEIYGYIFTYFDYSDIFGENDYLNYEYFDLHVHQADTNELLYNNHEGV